MLGFLGSINNWQWAGFGKHPIVKDYFQVGREHSLMNAFLDWVKKGYFEVSTKNLPDLQPCSWRFWAKIPKKETLACGLLKDSSDRIGRPYPLLIVGIGPLKSWEEYWDLLPQACDAMWQQTELLSTNMLRDFKELEENLIKIKKPGDTWDEFRTQRKRLWEKIENSYNLELIGERIQGVSDKMVFIIPLDVIKFSDQFTQVDIWHCYLKENLSVIPNAVFMGGAPDKAYLVVFKRPLQSSDFVLLWTISSRGENKNGTIVDW